MKARRYYSGLQLCSEGNPEAVVELAPLEATALVNELFLRLMTQSRVHVDDRAHFYSFAAKAMRRILVDYARGRATSKRGGGESRCPIDLNAGLDELERLDPSKARVVELRAFLGCTADEAAGLLVVSKATADRAYSFALAWLADRLDPSI